MRSIRIQGSSIVRCFAVGLFDVAGLVIVAMLALPALAEPAWAYVDPSVMTYTIQALAGVAVALSAVAGVAFRRSRKALMKALNIDENANKQVDSPWQRIEASDEAMHLGFQQLSGAGAAPAVGSTPQAHVEKSQYTPKWGKRLILSAFVVLFAVFTVLVDAPIEIVAGSEASLIFGLDLLWGPIIRFALLVFAVGLVLLPLFRGRVFNTLLMLVFAFALCCYVQAMFLNGGLTLANGSLIDWNAYRLKACWTFGVWLVIIIVPLALSWRWPAKLQMIAAIVSVVLVLVQGVAVASIFMGNASDNASVGLKTGAPASSYVTTQKGMFEVSPNENVIVFVLDTYDTKFLISALETYPDMLNDLTGFTWFKDSVGSMVPTRYGLPFLITGERPHYDETFQTFLRERYKRSSFLSDVESAGYSIGLYTDTLGEEFLSDQDKCDLIFDKTINIRSTARPMVNETGAIKGLLKCAIYRDICWFGKPFFWFYTDEINRLMGEYTSEEGFADAPYFIDDVTWYKNLKSFGISLDDDSERSFKLIHLNGTHWPYNINENGEDVGIGNASRDQQARGSLKMVEDYLAGMKQLGVYDQATIIITADHGDYYPIQGYLNEPTMPFMLVKPAQSTEEALQPIKESSAPVVAEDVLATVLNAMGTKGSVAGMPIFDIDEGGYRPRNYCMTINDDAGSDITIAEYEIAGNSLDFGNWALTGHEWDVWE